MPQERQSNSPTTLLLYALMKPTRESASIKTIVVKLHKPFPTPLTTISISLQEDRSLASCGLLLRTSVRYYAVPRDKKQLTCYCSSAAGRTEDLEASCKNKDARKKGEQSSAAELRFTPCKPLSLLNYSSVSLSSSGGMFVADYVCSQVQQ